MPAPRTQIRTQQVTSSLPASNEAALSAVPNHSSLEDTLKTLASSVRRINGFDDNSLLFYSDAQVFKSMASENRFVILNNQKLFVSSSTLLSGTTEISTSAGQFSVVGAQAATLNVAAKLNLTGTGVHVKASAGNLEFESQSGSTFIENGTEVFSINTDRKARFHQNAGSLASPDVEFDGKVRFDELVALSGSQLDFTKAADQVIEKNNSGDLTLSGTVGNITFIDTNTKSSTWTDKVKGVPLSTSAAQWTALQAAGIASIIDGLTKSSTANKYATTLEATLGAGSATALNMDFTHISDNQAQKRVDVFLNGQLMFSGSEAQRSAGTADYVLDKSGGVDDVEVKFSDGLVVGDVVTVTIR
ncbi:hypothetical protein OAA09_00980 [bacterium]|nr:hypothetical protein [bacterium]